MSNQLSGRLAVVAIITIFCVLPFTTPLAVFLGSHFGQPDLFKLWKEIVMVLVAGLLLAGGAYKTIVDVRDRWLKVLILLILGYAGWTLLLGFMNLMVFDQVDGEAFAYAVIINLRFLFFFLLCWLVARTATQLKENWQRLLLIPAGVVVAFGLLQAWVLPMNVLEHIGYGPETIPAYQAVDQHPDYARVQSTLRGPNPLGAYLIIIISALLIGLRRKWWPQIALLAGTLAVLFYTYSRSAWLGAAAAVAAIIFLSVDNERVRRSLVIAGAVAVLLFAGLVYAGRDNQFVQKTVFHTDETSTSAQSSNEQRASALQQGLRDVVREPFGRGPGSAGPASLRNDRHGERIAENYYLQIGQETGWIGLLLFLAITAYVAALLWQRRAHPLAKVLLASLAGIVLVNFLSHAWADETLAILWWGMAGIAVACTKPSGDRVAAAD